MCGLRQRALGLVVSPGSFSVAQATACRKIGFVTGGPTVPISLTNATVVSLPCSPLVTVAPVPMYMWTVSFVLFVSLLGFRLLTRFLTKTGYDKFLSSSNWKLYFIIFYTNIAIESNGMHFFTTENFRMTIWLFLMHFGYPLAACKLKNNHEAFF